jgi:hypothetical protein
MQAKPVGLNADEPFSTISRNTWQGCSGAASFRGKSHISASSAAFIGNCSGVSTLQYGGIVFGMVQAVIRSGEMMVLVMPSPTEA